MGTFHLQKFEKMQKIKDQMIVIIVLKQQNKTIIINLESIRKNSRWRWHLNKIVLIKRTKEVDWFVNCALLNGWLIFIILLFISEVCYTYFYALCLFHFILCCDVAHLVPFCKKKNKITLQKSQRIKNRYCVVTFSSSFKKIRLLFFLIFHWSRFVGNWFLIDIFSTLDCWLDCWLWSGKRRRLAKKLLP